MNIVIDSDVVSEIKVDGDWYSVKHGSLQIGEITWELEGEVVASGVQGFSFEIYGSQSMVVSGPVTSIAAIRYSRPL